MPIWTAPRAQQNKRPGGSWKWNHLLPSFLTAAAAQGKRDIKVLIVND